MYRYTPIQPLGVAPAHTGASRRLFSRPTSADGKDGNLESIGRWLGLMTKLGLLYGGAWLFAYCFFVIGFFPAGISASDSVFLLFVAVSFGLVVLMLSGVGLHLVDPWFGLAQFILSKSGAGGKAFPVWGKVAGAVMGLIALTIAVLVVFEINVPQGAWQGLISVLLAAYCVVAFCVKKYADSSSDIVDAAGSGVLSVLSALVLLLFIGFKQWWAIPLVFTQGLLAAAFTVIWRSSRHNKNRVIGLLILTALNLFAPIYLTLLFKGDHQVNPTLALTFERLGTYRGTADVMLSNNAAQQLWQLSSDHDMGIQGCQLDDGSLLMSRVQVLWHGVGTRSLLRFPTHDSSSSLTQRRVELEASDVRLLSVLSQQCAQLPTEIHFASKSDKPIDQKELNELQDQFSQAIERAPEGWRLVTVQLRGHADPMPFGKQGNVELGLARARVVGTELVRQFDLGENIHRGIVNLDVQSSASRSGRSSTCPLKGEPASLEECHAKSRRVEVRLIFKAVAMAAK